MGNFAITVSRGYGSGGKIVGKALAEALNIDFVDRELLQMASEESGINETLFNAADENEKFKGGLFFKKHVYRGGIITPEEDGFTSNENLFNYQAKVLKQLIEKESFVVMGRAANYVLKDYPNVVSVNIQAPYEFCVKMTMETMKVGEKDARRYVNNITKYRKEYYEYYSGADWNDPLGYDLSLNSARVGVDNCVRVIIGYLKLKQLI